GQGRHPVHCCDDGGGIGSVAVSICKVGRAYRELQRLLVIAIPEPDAGRDDAEIDDRIISRGIFDSPTLVDRTKDLLRGSTGIRHRCHLIETLTVGRIGVKQQRGFTHDAVCIFFAECDADHARYEHCSVRALGIAINMSEIALQVEQSTQWNVGVNVNAAIPRVLMYVLPSPSIFFRWNRTLTAFNPSFKHARPITSGGAAPLRPNPSRPPRPDRRPGCPGTAPP